MLKFWAKYEYSVTIAALIWRGVKKTVFVMGGWSGQGRAGREF